MATIIRKRQVVSDSWQLLDEVVDDPCPERQLTGDTIIPLAMWQERRRELVAQPRRLGVWLDGGDDPALIAEDLKNFGVVAVRFPHFTDGRGYSLGRLLRERYGWRGELRAIGDIARDQLLYLARTGFDAFVLREGEDPIAALAAFDDFSESYQAAVDQPLPLFRRRLAGAPDGMA